MNPFQVLRWNEWEDNFFGMSSSWTFAQTTPMGEVPLKGGQKKFAGTSFKLNQMRFPLPGVNPMKYIWFWKSVNKL